MRTDSVSTGPVKIGGCTVYPTKFLEVGEICVAYSIGEHPGSYKAAIVTGEVPCDTYLKKEFLAKGLTDS